MSISRRRCKRGSRWRSAAAPAGEAMSLDTLYADRIEEGIQRLIAAQFNEDGSFKPPTSPDVVQADSDDVAVDLSVPAAEWPVSTPSKGMEPVDQAGALSGLAKSPPRHV